jgi:hypothetical protein
MLILPSGMLLRDMLHGCTWASHHFPMIMLVFLYKNRRVGCGWTGGTKSRLHVLETFENSVQMRIFGPK